MALAFAESKWSYSLSGSFAHRPLPSGAPHVVLVVAAALANYPAIVLILQLLPKVSISSLWWQPLPLLRLLPIAEAGADSPGFRRSLPGVSHILRCWAYTCGLLRGSRVGAALRLFLFFVVLRF